jgi:UDP-N-acetylglucosamine:LPS N-acetylglucosamine transferase
LKDFSPDLIISTSPLSSKYASVYKERKGENSVPVITYITDITYHSQWLSVCTDAYFVASENIKNSLIKKGIKSERIFVSPIPVKKEFKTPFSPAAGSSCKHIVVMGGGLGLIPVNAGFLSRLNQFKDVHTTVITGTNIKLYNRLKNRYRNLEILGYSDNVHHLMQNADIIITKPGGVTLFESINAQVPMFVILPVLAHEISNARYIEEKGLGMVIWDKRADAFNELIELIGDEDKIILMKNQIIKIKEQTCVAGINKIIRDWNIGAHK